MTQESVNRAKVLIEALPYIQQFTGKLMVIKYGGSLMMDDDVKPMFAQDIVLLKCVGIHPVIVHGGGKEISKWMGKVGKEAVFIDGLRVTDAETMEITEMVLRGKINSEVVSLVNRYGGRAVGLSGKDANLFVAKKMASEANKDLGFVGDIQDVDTTLIYTLSQKGYIPIISSVGASRQNETLNMNADHVAEQFAVALGSEKLIYLTDVDGILKEGVLQRKVSLPDARVLFEHPDIKGGMRPKLRCAISALEGGVRSVHIINGNKPHAVLLELLTDYGIGTMLSGDVA